MLNILDLEIQTEISYYNIQSHNNSLSSNDFCYLIIT